MKKLIIIALSICLPTICSGFSPADFDFDGYVDYFDLATFTGQWLANDPNFENPADFNSDGIVDFKDFATFASQWLPQNRYTGGSGTSENPYQITNVADWQALMATSADWGKYFVLTADIGLQDIEITPVGDSNQKFTGSLDGAGHTILNAVINRPDYDYVGLFGYVGNGSNIRNLGLESVNITGRDYVGGLIGRSDYGSVTDCHVTGSVGGAYYAGGLIGRSDYGSVTDCYVSGSVGGADYAGGLIGSNSCNVSYCYATGSISGKSNVGGLIGLNSGGISNCYGTGYVMGDSDSNCVGGLIGNNSGDVNYCYATGLVSGDSNFGGLVGFNDGAVDNSFWDIRTSGQTTSAGGTGKTTVEMKTLVTFTSAGWDFSDTDGDPADWKMLESITYPSLSWQVPLILVASSDAPAWFRSKANYICDGISDQAQINSALFGNNRHAILSSGTFNISAMVLVNYNNIILEGQGPSTIIRNTSNTPLHVVYECGPKHDITIRNLQIDNNDHGNPADAWNKCLFINGNGTTVFGSDLHKYLCIKAHIANPDNHPATGPNFKTYWALINGWGVSETWVEGKSYTGIDSCNNILIEGVTGHDSKAEVICVDYAEHITIRDCNSYNGAWSGITVAHTRYSSIYNNQIRHCGESVADGDAMSRGINIIGSSHVSVYDNWIRDCIAGGIGVNETYGMVESVDINIYDNHIIDTIGGPGIVTQSSNSGVSDSNTYDVNIWGNYVDTYREVKLDADGVAVNNSDGNVTLPATYNGFREMLLVKITGTINYNGYFTLKKGTDDDHLVISHAYFAEQFNGTETVSQSTEGMWFDCVINFNVRNNTIEPGTAYWCYVKSAAYNGLVEDNMYTAGGTYVNQSPSTLFINNTEIPP